MGVICVYHSSSQTNSRSQMPDEMPRLCVIALSVQPLNLLAYHEPLDLTCLPFLSWVFEGLITTPDGQETICKFLCGHLVTLLQTLYPDI